MPPVLAFEGIRRWLGRFAGVALKATCVLWVLGRLVCRLHPSPLWAWDEGGAYQGAWTCLS